MIVTLDGWLGRLRDHRIRNSPTFATNNGPFGRTLNPLRVSRNDCRLSFRDFIRGLLTLQPFRFPDRESKKLRNARWASLTDWTNATLGASFSQPRSGVVLASVITRR
jgi:hypothetical protein